MDFNFLFLIDVFDLFPDFADFSVIVPHGCSPDNDD